jgi:hypothetical protein
MNVCGILQDMGGRRDGGFEAERANSRSRGVREAGSS